MAINSTVQGTAAEIVKLGMIAVEKNLQKAGIDGYILLQIHDEILLEVKESHAQHAAAIVKETLETILQWSVPLSVQTLIGSNWHEVSK
jgi:DNA polymerase-1